MDIGKMTTKELEELLAEVSDDPVKTIVIKNMIKQRELKKKLKVAKKKHDRSDQAKHKHNRYDELIKKIDSDIDKDFEIFDDSSLDEMIDEYETERRKPHITDMNNRKNSSRFATDIMIHEAQKHGTGHHVMGLFGEEFSYD